MPGIESLYRFALSQTRDAFKQSTGKEAPPWDPSKPIKSWVDPDPPDADEEGNVKYTVLALAADKKTPAVGANGRPYLRTLTISRADAMVPNIPLKDFARDTQTVDPGALSPMASVDLPVPCRALQPDEELFFAFGGLVQVRKKSDLPPAPAQPVSTSPAIEARLAAIETNQQAILVNQQTILAKMEILLATNNQ
jgi:hypothetical protein